MRKNVEFQMEDVAEIPQWTELYPEHKFTVYKCCFLSTKPNAHRLNIDDGVLREYANTILGNFLVAKVQFGDAMSHEKDEIIYGYFPREQEVEFVEDDDVTLLGHVLGEPPQVGVDPLVTHGCGHGYGVVSPGVQRTGDPLDASTLSGSIPAFVDNNHGNLLPI